MIKFLTIGVAQQNKILLKLSAVFRGQFTLFSGINLIIFPCYQ